ncbi:hypothetical protein RN001_015535 [Aquatica leii]|uniref:Cilia-and flagella-associated protein 96 n=1 Tax=Aquatica leii TaxID=1421715 RepID=A0AAN7P1B2_9COLE|nr:hypothetical protein RN001_015535 [Aquatica leii]
MSNIVEQAHKYGKPDMERLGLFVEMPYLNGKGYTPAYAKPKLFKGLNMYPGGPKTKCGTQHGYFDDEFRRVFIGEGITRRKKSQKTKKEEPITPFLPAGVPKKHATPGDHFGTFTGIIAAFSRIQRKAPPFKREPANFSTNPGKKGGGGYANICLSKYPVHLKDPYRPKLKAKEYGKQLGGPMITCHYPKESFGPNPYPENNKKNLRLYVRPKEPKYNIVGDGKWMPTGPAKWPGGCKAGMFERFPLHMTDRSKPKAVKKKKEEGPTYLPQCTALKSMYIASVLKKNVDISCNVMNYKTFEPSYTKRMLQPLF